jgi:hypothetical protein
MRRGEGRRHDGPMDNEFARAEPVEAAGAIVRDRFPDARAAFLSAGILSPRRTPTSDLDIVVVLAGSPAPYRESLRWQGWPIELFVHDADSLGHFFASDTARRRPTLARMCTEGVVLAGDEHTIENVRERAKSVVEIGPPPLSSAELDLARYILTDLLDDLAGSADPGETAVIGWNVWTATAELALMLAGNWLGSGKWLLRELRAADPDLGDRMVAAIGSPARLTQVADEVLGRAGGRFWAGLRVAGS